MTLRRDPGADRRLYLEDRSEIVIVLELVLVLDLWGTELSDLRMRSGGELFATPGTASGSHFDLGSKNCTGI